MILGEVNIGSNIYVGSGAKILQGVTICDNAVIGAGSIISKSIKESGFYVSSQQIRKSNLPDYSKDKRMIEYKNAKFIRK